MYVCMYVCIEQYWVFFFSNPLFYALFSTFERKNGSLFFLTWCMYVCMFVWAGDLHGPATWDKVHSVCGGGQASGSQRQARHHRRHQGHLHSTGRFLYAYIHTYHTYVHTDTYCTYILHTHTYIHTYIGFHAKYTQHTYLLTTLVHTVLH